MNDVLTVVIPTHNAAATLATALQSLADQVFQNFEIIIQDAVSSDSTVAIASAFKPIFGNRIHIAVEKDFGIYDAMNKGITKAKGNWLYFMGADDRLFSPEILMEISEYFSDTEKVLLMGKISTDDSDIGDITIQRLLNENICHQAIFYHRKVFQQLGLYNTRYRIFADWDFNIRCLFAGLNAVALNKTIAVYGITGISNQTGDKLFHRELCFTIPYYQFKFAKGLQKGYYLPKMIRGFLVLKSKELKSLF